MKQIDNYEIIQKEKIGYWVHEITGNLKTNTLTSKFVFKFEKYIKN